MKQKSMTALISAFARAYHSENNAVKIFDDSVARCLFTEEEYDRIASSMACGIDFFNPHFMGTPQEALRWVADHQLSPSPLGRAAFAERALQTAASIGTRQYLIFGAGYDTFAYRQPAWANAMRIFEIDRPSVAQDKRARLEKAKIAIPKNVQYIATDFLKEDWQTALTQNILFRESRTCFCSILGVTYYLSRQTFTELVFALSSIVSVGSAIVFDYPNKSSGNEKAGTRVEKQALLAAAANEKMLASYSYEDMEQILSAAGFLIYEHLTPSEITQQYFAAYNRADPLHPMTAFENVNYCLAVKK